MRVMYTSMKLFSWALFWAALLVIILGLPVLAQNTKSIGGFGDWEAYR